VTLKIIPCAECTARTVCRAYYELARLGDKLTRAMWVVESKEATLSFSCRYFIQRKEGDEE